MPDAARPPATPTTPDVRGTKRRRWPKILLGVVGLLVVLVVAGPWLAAPVVRGLLVDGIEDNLDASARVESLNLRHGAGLRLQGLVVDERDADGRPDPNLPLMRLGLLDAHIGLLSLLSNQAVVNVTVDGFELHVRQGADGRTNIERVLKTPKPERDDDKQDKAPTRADDLPRVTAHIDVRGGRVVVHGQGGATELRDITLLVDVEGLKAPAIWSASLALAGPGGPGGRVAVSGEVRLDEVLQPADASLDYTLDDLLLASLSPALQALADIAVTGGKLAGQGHYDIQPAALKLSGTSAIALTGLVLAGPAFGAQPLSVPDIVLDAEGDMGATGSAGHHLRMTVGDALVLDAALGPLSLADGGRAGVTVEAQLDRLTELLRPWLPLQAGHALDGALSARADLDLRTRPAPAGSATGTTPSLTGLDLGGHLELRDLAVRDGSGAAVPLGELTGLTADADLGLAWDGGPTGAGLGTATLRTLAIDAGPLQVSGHGSLGGLPAVPPPPGASFDATALRPGATQFKLTADLDRLSASLAPLLAPPPAAGASAGAGANAPAWSLAGQLTADIQSAAAGSAPGRNGLPALPAEALLSLRVTELAVADGRGLRAELESLVTTQRWSAASQTPKLKGMFALAGLALDDGAGLTVALDNLDAQDTLELDGDVAGVVVDARLMGLAASRPDLAAPVNLAMLGAGLDAHFDTASGVLDLARLDASLPGAQLAGRGKLALDTSSWQPSSTPGSTELALDWSAQLDELGRLAAPFMQGLEIAGSPLAGSVSVSRLADGWRARGNADGPRLALTLPPKPDAEVGAAPVTLIQKDLELVFDVSVDPAEAATITTLRFGSATARGGVTGVFGIADPDATRLALSLDGELPVLLADLGPLVPLPVRNPKGTLAVRHDLRHAAGRWIVGGATTIDGFGMTLPSSTPGGADLVLSDPAVKLTLDADVGLGAADSAADPAAAVIDVALTRLALASSLLWGQMSGGLTASGAAGAGQVIEARGLNGRFTYVPERLGALLGPLLPVSWRGADEQVLEFSFDGRIDPADLAASLEAATLDIGGGTGLLVSPLAEVSGRFGLKLADGRGQLLTTLAVASSQAGVEVGGGSQAPPGTTSGNKVGSKLGAKAAAGGGADDPPAVPGQVVFTLDFDARDGADALTRMQLDIAAVDARAKLAELLTGVHPLFAKAAGEGGLVRAMVDGHFELSYAGPLIATLQSALAEGGGGLGAIPTAPLSGQGTLGVSKALIKSSPLAGEILAKLGLPVTEEASLDPLVFRLEQGRVHYAEPWDWLIAGYATQWTGSVGLDQTLDMAFSLPITKELVAKYEKLAPLEGEPLSLNITGRLDAPNLHWNDVLGNLLKQTVEKRISDPLDVLLGKGKQDPAALLIEADKLWAAGKQDEARVIYKQLESTYKYTLVFQLNKQRIKDRADD